MNSQNLHTTKITRKRFLQMSLLAAAGLFLWSPFKQEAQASGVLTPVTSQDGTNLPLGKMKTMQVMSQNEYDALRPDPQTMYIIT